MLRASHLAAFAAGAVVALAALAAARSSPDARYRALDAFAEVLARVELDYVDPVDEAALVRDAIRGVLHNRDPYSTYLPPRRYARVRQDVEGAYGSVGVTLAPGQVDEARPGVPPWPVIDEVIPGSPAAVAGLQPEDVVVAIDGEPTAEVGRERRDAGAWEARLRGASGTRVSLSVTRVGVRAPRVVTLVRARVEVPSVRGRPLAEGIGYLAISRFVESTAADAAGQLAALRAAGALRALVLDLRGDPGGVIEQAIATADLFLASGTIATLRGRRGVLETYTAHAAGTWTGFPIVLLVDGGTASAAELLAAALHDHRRATLVGLPTFGKGSVQTFFELADGAGIKLTTSRYLTPAGNSLESKGIIPDVRIEAFAGEVITAGPGSAEGESDATLAEGTGDDPQLEAALRLARGALPAP